MSDSSEEQQIAGDNDPPVPDQSANEDSSGSWFRIFREVAISVLIVLIIAGILFGLSGVWPPLVAVESDSMEPQIMTGDLVFIVEADRFSADEAIDGTGVVPADRAADVDHSAFDRPGDVIVFAPNGNPDATPIIHRAHLWVSEGENWYDRTDDRLTGGAESCDELVNCPAPNAGFITHGDNNAFYDQVQRDSQPIKPEWVIARGWMRIPWVGHIRLILGDLMAITLPVGMLRSHVEA